MTIIGKIKNIFSRSMNNKLTYSEVKNIMKNNYSTILIDVRSRQEFGEGHIANAINLPVYDLEKKINNYVPDKSNIIILYCQTEIRSNKAKRILEKVGYRDIYILKGGMDSIVTIHG